MQRIQQLINNPIVITVCRVMVGGIFIFAGLLKLLEPIEEFIAIGRSWDIISDPLLTWYMTALPWVEFIAGVFVLTGFQRKIGASLIALMLVSFLIAIGINMGRGRTLEDCGCFGGALEFGTTFAEIFWRDIVLLLGTVVLILAKPKAWLELDRLLDKKRLVQ